MRSYERGHCPLKVNVQHCTYFFLTMDKYVMFTLMLRVLLSFSDVHHASVESLGHVTDSIIRRLYDIHISSFAYLSRN